MTPLWTYSISEIAESDCSDLPQSGSDQPHQSFSSFPSDEWTYHDGLFSETEQNLRDSRIIWRNLLFSHSDNSPVGHYNHVLFITIDTIAPGLVLLPSQSA